MMMEISIAKATFPASYQPSRHRPGSFRLGASKFRGNKSDIGASIDMSMRRINTLLPNRRGIINVNDYGPTPEMRKR